jgi:CRP-like cAMP-binding protein
MMTVEQALKGHPFTRGLSALHMDRLAALACEETFAQNQIILVAGEQSRNLYLLLSGSVCVEVCAPHYTVTVQSLGPGEAFGWMAAVLVRSVNRTPSSAWRCSARSWNWLPAG